MPTVTRDTMRVGNRYNENCVALQLAGKDIVYVSELFKEFGVFPIRRNQIRRN